MDNSDDEDFTNVDGLSESKQATTVEESSLGEKICLTSLITWYRFSSTLVSAHAAAPLSNALTSMAAVW